MSKPAGLASFTGHKYMNLETFRKNGEGVRTPVWFAAEPSAGVESGRAKLYLYTIGDTGKVKRLRNNGRVRIAPCDMRGKLLGAWVEVRAEIVTGQEAAHGMSLLNKKYWPLKQLMGFFASFRRRERVVIEIRPV